MENDINFDDFLLPQYRKNKQAQTTIQPFEMTQSYQMNSFTTESKKNSTKPSFYHFSNIINVKQFQKRVVKKYDIDIVSPKTQLLGNQNGFKQQRNSILSDLNNQQNLIQQFKSDNKQFDLSKIEEGKFSYKFEKTANDSVAIEIQSNDKKQKSRLSSRQIKSRYLQKYQNFLNNPNIDSNYKIQKIQEGYDNLIQNVSNQFSSLSDKNQFSIQTENFKQFYLKRVQQNIINETDSKDQISFSQQYMQNVKDQIIDDIIQKNIGKIFNLKDLNNSLEINNISIKDDQYTDIQDQSQLYINQKQAKLSEFYEDLQKEEPNEDILQQMQSFDNMRQRVQIQQNINETQQEQKKSDLNQTQLTNPNNMSNSIVDQLLNAQNIFEVDLNQFKKEQITYPAIPKINFKDDDERRVFEKLFHWLFEIEVELQQGRKMVEEYKILNGFTNQVANQNQNSDQEEDSDEGEDAFEDLQ